MMGLRTWFAALSLREKRMVLAMLALLAITIVWAGVIRPVGDANASARARYADAVVRLGETQARVAALRESQRDRALPLDAPLADSVRRRADAAGFTIASLDADGPAHVRITIPTARPGAFFAWIAGLEAAGILVDAVTITNNGDRTIGAQMTLKARAT